MDNGAPARPLTHPPAHPPTYLPAEPPPVVAAEGGAAWWWWASSDMHMHRIGRVRRTAGELITLARPVANLAAPRPLPANAWACDSIAASRSRRGDIAGTERAMVEMVY